MPARFLRHPREAGYGRFLFHDQRYHDDGSERPEFFLNQPPWREARILVGNANFGCGSSREGAVYALADYGFRAVIAPSFGDIFQGNCLRNGLLPVRLDAEVVAGVRARLAASPGGRLRVDLASQTVTESSRIVHRFEVDPFRKEALVSGLDEIGLTLELAERITAFEARYRAERPWLP